MRLLAMNTPIFRHDGLAVGESWSEFDYAAADVKTQRAFRKYVGRFVRIHPGDVAELAELGLALEGGVIVDAPPAAPAAPATNAPPAAPAAPSPDDSKTAPIARPGGKSR